MGFSKQKKEINGISIVYSNKHIWEKQGYHVALAVQYCTI